MTASDHGPELRPSAAPGPQTTAPEQVSVIIAAHTMKRWDELCTCVASALAQRPSPHEVIVSVDNNPELHQRVAAELTGARTVLHTGPRGASGTRNTGARAATGSVLAFLDDDAVAEEGWLAALIEPLRTRPDVVGVGGFVQPLWRGTEPAWLPLEFYWVVGASYRGMPETAAPIRNVWAENMAVRTADFWAVDGFRETFGKVGDNSKPEDTDFCIRVAGAEPRRTWWFAPDARIGHTVPAERSSWSFYLRRCLNEGRGKAELAALVGDREGLSDERGQATKVIPRGVALELTHAVRDRDLDAARRAGALIAGLGAAGIGFASARVAQLRGRRDRMTTQRH